MNEDEIAINSYCNNYRDEWWLPEGDNIPLW